MVFAVDVTSLAVYPLAAFPAVTADAIRGY